MQAPKTKAELQLHKAKLANSYTELLERLSSKDLSHIGLYTVGKQIASGSFGKVFLARHDLCGSKVVLKAAKKDDLAREINIHRQLLHPHIAQLYEIVLTETKVYLSLEFCPGEDLHTFVSKGPVPVESAQRIFSQLLSSLIYIHSKGCVHRDLKLENILLDRNGNVKLVDFGLAREYEGNASYLQTYCGTVAYSAPEILRGQRYAAEKVDVWSLGIILYTLLKGELPFDEDDDAATKAKILNEEPVYPDTFPPGAKTLISKLLSKRPLPRPALTEVLADPFLSEFAPVQQAILKLAQPAPFSTPLEKTVLERLKIAGINIDALIESVLSQKCDSLAGWWALLLEKETRKEARRERKRKEREAELKLLRRLSGASGRFNMLALEQVDEEGSKDGVKPRSSSRGRAQNRRSTPQILVTDLPQLPENSALDSPTTGQTTPPPPPVDKDSLHPRPSRSLSRPPPPPKERTRRRSSTLQLVATNPDLLAPQSIINGVSKRRQKQKNNQFLLSVEKLKHWFVESTKRSKSPGKANSVDSGDSKSNSRPITATKESSPLSQKRSQHNRQLSTTSSTRMRNSYGATLTPVVSNGIKLDTSGSALAQRQQQQRGHRNSLSPSPLTPRSSYRRSSGGMGLRGRKSTSSSVSSIRSLPRHTTQTHSKASSRSSNSMDTIHSPGNRSLSGRSPHHSIKVLPATPVTGADTSFGRFTRNLPSMGEESDGVSLNGPRSRFNEAAIMPSGGAGGVMFAKRGKKAFRGPMLNSGLFGGDKSTGLGSPAVGAGINQRSSDGKLNLGLRDLVSRKREMMRDGSPAGSGGGSGTNRKSLILEEEEEEDDPREHAILEEDEEDEEGGIEEVEEFSDVETNLRRGERVHSIVIYPAISTERLDEHGVEGDGALMGAKDEEKPPASATSEKGQVSATMDGRWDDGVHVV